VGGGAFEADDPQVRALCARVDGIPLAIELAAARTRTLHLGQIIERLEHGLDLLAATRRGSPDRHQTLRATIEWSYRALHDDERALFKSLGVFSGSFDLDAAASVSGESDVTDLLEGLVQKSIVITVPEVEDRRRYRLLDSLRVFALEQLSTRPDDLDRARDAHARYYLERLAAVPSSRCMARDLRADFELDLGNILVATDHPDAQISEAVVFLFTNMGLFGEAKRACDAALARNIDDGKRGTLLVARAYAEATQDGTSDFRAIAAEALRYLRPGDGVWSAALGMTSVFEQMFAPDTAVQSLQEALEHIEDQNSATADHDRAVLRFYLGGALMNQRAYESASETQLRAARALEAIEPTSLIRLWTAAGAAMSLTLLDRYDDANAVLDGVGALAGWTDWSVDWYFARALLHARRGNVDEARNVLATIGARFGNVSVSPMTGTVVAGFGVLAHFEGRPDRARTLLEFIVATRSAASTAVMYETIADFDGWSDDEFEARRLQRAVDILQSHGGTERSEYFDALGVLLREELSAAPVR
jgi:tetratricopeptide (TPR) repeat protein